MEKIAHVRPPASLVISLMALVLAASGTAIAAGGLAGGDGLIRKNSLSGNRLRAHTLTRTEINLGRLGQVPDAKSADYATDAGSATTASNASRLGGQAPSSYLTSSDLVGTKGIAKISATAAGHTVTLFSSGPFTVTATCTSSSNGPGMTINASSSEANSDLDGNFAAANTPTDLNQDIAPSTTPFSYDGLDLDFEAPSGAQAIVTGGAGVASLGTDCWANLSGTG
jgi:hypothetical protein